MGSIRPLKLNSIRMKKISLIVLSIITNIACFAQVTPGGTRDSVDLGKQAITTESPKTESTLKSASLSSDTTSQVPRTFKYQAVARDAANQVLSNKLVNLKISIVADNENGVVAYSETHLATTNALGLINLEIGAGTAVFGTFDAISWGSAAYYIKIEMDADGGDNFKEMGTSKLLAVPYALYAENAGGGSHLKSGSTSQWTTLDANSIQSDYPKVGIGTGGSIPYATLDIRGTTYNSIPTAYGTQIAGGNIELTRSSYPYIDFTTNLNVDYNARLIYFSTGNYLQLAGANFYAVANAWLVGQTGVGTTSPNASAKLDVTSTTQGFLTPRMTTAQRNAIASPATGLVIFNTETNCFNFYTGTVWFEMCGQTPGQSVHPCNGITNFTYGGQVYHTVEIGTQCWMKENLNVGTMIDTSIVASNNGVIEKYCYKNDCNLYGGYYTYGEAMNYQTTEGSQGICPFGWHIPSYSELGNLANFFTSPYVAYTALISGGSSGFNGFLAGMFWWSPPPNSEFDLYGEYGYFESSTSTNGTVESYCLRKIKHL